MDVSNPVWASPIEFLQTVNPENPVMFFAPKALQARTQQFLKGFPGLVTYAVKANPDISVLQSLVSHGITGFDVASPEEIQLMRSLAPEAALHYHNPVRARSEIEFAQRMGVKSYSVDSRSELAKLAEILDPEGVEISVRFALPVDGASYNFGAKFGAIPAAAADLLREVARLGFITSMTFHPGTQCTDAEAWHKYILAAADIAANAGVKIERLNVGGGFPSQRSNEAGDLDEIFGVIDQATTEAFGDNRPALVCEPGRALVADAFALSVGIKAIRDGADVFLNDGIYGGLSEQHLIGLTQRLLAVHPDGTLVAGEGVPHRLFGPTCDSMDMMPGVTHLPAELAEGDYIIFYSLGAYSTATATRFNGFGDLQLATVHTL
ncbi:MAG: type III PLP-dependent enzyme [Rhodobacteraceae bacterium]|nr:type III PLP-dependent enzyme [Paracoccaceae bacterium]